MTQTRHRPAWRVRQPLCVSGSWLLPCATCFGTETFQLPPHTPVPYYSGKWHMGDKPEAYPIEHGFDEMKAFAAYYPGVYTYSDTSVWFHPWFPSYNADYKKEYFDIVNMYEWEGEAGKPPRKGAYIDWDYLATFDVRQADFAIDYIKQHGTVPGVAKVTAQ